LTDGVAGSGAGSGTELSSAAGVAATARGSSGQLADVRRGLLLTAATSVVSPATWLALIHLMTGVITGLIAAAIVMTGIVAGLALLPAFLLGILVLLATIWFGMRFARFERARFAFFLDERITAPPGPPAENGWRRMWRPVTRAAAWKSLVYAILRLPLSAIEALLAMLAWCTGLALVGVPGYGTALPGGAAHIGTFRFGGIWWAALAVVTGVALLLAAPFATRALAIVDASIARWLLGSADRAQLTARIGELETSRARVIDAAEAERMRIERDLHDGAQQRLVSLAMELGRAKAKLESDPEAAAAIVSSAHEQAKAALAELRNLVRGVHPPVLSDRGLDAALSGLAALCPVPVSVQVRLPVRPPAAVEAIAYFVVAEALTNVAKHARASRAEVTVGLSGGTLMLVIRDDGVGGADPAGRGLSGLAARVAGVDGQLRVTSPAGGPTSIAVVLPCES